MKELNEYTAVDWTMLVQKYSPKLRFNSQIQEYVFSVDYEFRISETRNWFKSLARSEFARTAT